VSAFLAGLERLLAERRMPVLIGLLTALVSVFVWRGLREPGDVHDELAYLLQARTYARGHWALPSPPRPEFFEQYHVLVTPTLSSKYPPGHALALVPGVALGLPGLMPVVLSGLAGGFVFALARRLASGSVAALTWLLWLTAPASLGFRASYLSQVTTTGLWLASCWYLWNWVEGRRPRSLAAVGALYAAMALTRPLTAIALGLPAAAVVLVLAFRRRAYKDLAFAGLAKLAILSLLPFSNAAVTGDWLTLPYALHTKVYLPFVHLGFGASDAQPLRPLPPDMQVFTEAYRAVHRDHSLAKLPSTAWSRLRAVTGEEWGGAPWRGALAVLGLLGLAFLTRPALFGLASFVCLFSAHLLYAHPLGWLVYYEETQAMLAFLPAIGLMVGGSRFVGPDRLPWLAGSTILLVAALGLHDAWLVRQHWPDRTAFRKAFATLLAHIPDSKAVVFVRYGARHNPDQALVVNDPDGADARLWVVYDRGPKENGSLLRAAPERTPWLFDEAKGWLGPYPNLPNDGRAAPVP
jgi:hypothetical protein